MNSYTGSMQQQQQIQQEQIQAQQQHELELERVKNADFRMQIAFKDAPLPIQFAMAAQAGLIDRSIADYFIQTMVQQMAPQLAMQMNQQVPPQQMPQVPLPQMQQMPVQQPQENPAAVQSAMNGIMPAAM